MFQGKHSYTHLRMTRLLQTYQPTALLFILLLALTGGCGGADASPQRSASTNASSGSSFGPTSERNDMNTSLPSSTDTATFGAGCFWCVEAVFQQLDGVVSVDPGYAGGEIEKPTYEQVCTGMTGHAEVCTIVYDPEKLSYADLLEAFFSSHDPTTLNRQGADVGTQYRSVIFYHNDAQRETAAQYRADLDRSGTFKDPIVTEIAAHTITWPAENYHQDYYDRNPRQAYCQYVIKPKLDKFTKQFKDKLKK
jgi:peptide-methionine (S)-S-oxide reductase